VKFRESLISAHHNYLVNQMLTPGFVLGDPDSADDFFFLGDVLLPPGSEPMVRGRLFDERGVFVMRIAGQEVLENPGGCVLQKLAGGFRIFYSSGEPLLSVHTEAFANGYLTRIQGKLYDRDGKIRMEPTYDSARVFGEKTLPLSSPLLSNSPA
jgi:hypothetical protein